MIARPQQRQKLRQRLRLERWAAPFVWGVLVLYVVGSLLSTWRLPHHLEPSGVAKEHARASARGMRGVGSPGNPLLADILRRRGASQALCPAQYNASAPHSRGMFNLREDMARGAPECNADIPAMMCGETQFTIITMSYPGTKSPKLQRLGIELNHMAKWDMVAEIVMVWNGDAENFYERDVYERLYKDMPGFRVFEAKSNSLMNRYDPAIKPKTAAIMYLDDDGPFIAEAPANIGFTWWRQNSNRQVGGLGRHIKYVSPRQTSDAEPASGFTPFCNGDAVGYHYEGFPDFYSHMVLPSYAFMHRDYLCYIFSPAFAGVRDFVNGHITMPDDIAVSFIVSHVAGLAPATYPRRIRKEKGGGGKNDGGPAADNVVHIENHAAASGRKMLLYKDSTFGGTGKNRTWVKHRSDALTWLATYFGSINPGSREGWCVGREEHVLTWWMKRASVKEKCDPAFPAHVSEVRWMDGSCPTPWPQDAKPRRLEPPTRAPKSAKGDAKAWEPPECTPLSFNASRYYGLNSDATRELDFLSESKYVRGHWPQLLRPVSGNPQKICHLEEERHRFDGKDTQGHNPSVLELPPKMRVGSATYLATTVVGVGQCSWPSRPSRVGAAQREHTAVMVLDEDFNVIGQTLLRLTLDQEWGRGMDTKVTRDNTAIKFDDAKLLMHHGRVFVTYRHRAYPQKIQLLNPVVLDISEGGAHKVKVEAHVEASKTVELCCGRNIGLMSMPKGDANIIHALNWMNEPHLIEIKIKEVDLTTGRSGLLHRRVVYLAGDAAAAPESGSIEIHGTSGYLPYIPETNEFVGLAHIHRPVDRHRNEYALHGHHYTHAYFAMAADVLTVPKGQSWEGRLRMGNEFTFPSLAWAAALPRPASAPAHAVEDSEIIQYAGGLSLLHSLHSDEVSSRLLISYGVNDCESAIYSMSMEEVLATGLADVDTSSLVAPLQR